MTTQPLAELPEGEEAVPYVTTLDKGPPRCRRCRAYINCHATFVDGGRHWTCNFCGMANAVEADYFCALDHQGKRRDLASRPELFYGSVDFAATAEYCNRAPMHPSLMFAVDVSAAALASGLLAASVNAVLQAPPSFPVHLHVMYMYVNYMYMHALARARTHTHTHRRWRRWHRTGRCTQSCRWVSAPSTPTSTSSTCSARARTRSCRR